MARKRGRGMAVCWYGIARTAPADRAAAWAEIDDGGSVKVVTGVTEIAVGDNANGGGESACVRRADGTVYWWIVRELWVLPEDGQPESVRLANARYVQPTADSRLTLVSCWPVTNNTHRIFVVAKPKK